VRVPRRRGRGRPPGRVVSKRTPLEPSPPRQPCGARPTGRCCRRSRARRAAERRAGTSSRGRRPQRVGAAAGTSAPAGPRAGGKAACPSRASRLLRPRSRPCTIGGSPSSPRSRSTAQGRCPTSSRSSSTSSMSRPCRLPPVQARSASAVAGAIGPCHGEHPLTRRREPVSDRLHPSERVTHVQPREYAQRADRNSSRPSSKFAPKRARTRKAACARDPRVPRRPRPSSPARPSNTHGREAGMPG
jgi:hypothetical protein